MGGQRRRCVESCIGLRLRRHVLLVHNLGVNSYFKWLGVGLRNLGGSHIIIPHVVVSNTHVVTEGAFSYPRLSPHLSAAVIILKGFRQQHILILL